MKSVGKETVEYKGYYIDHFPYSWNDSNGNIIKEVDAWIILSPNYLELDDGDKIYLPLYTHNEDNTRAEFDTLKEAQDYIDKYMVPGLGEYKMLNRDECHYIIKKVNESLLNEVYPHKGESKKDFTARFMSATKDEYPDIKQRYAVCMSYWDRKNKKNKIKESEGIIKMKAIKLTEASLSYGEQKAKMQACENGTRGFNAKAASDEKLRYNRDVCHREGFTRALRIVEDEMINRGMLTRAASYTYGGGQQQAPQPTPKPVEPEITTVDIPTIIDNTKAVQLKDPTDYGCSNYQFNMNGKVIQVTGTRKALTDWIKATFTPYASDFAGFDFFGDGSGIIFDASLAQQVAQQAPVNNSVVLFDRLAKQAANGSKSHIKLLLKVFNNVFNDMSRFFAEMSPNGYNLTVDGQTAGYSDISSLAKAIKEVLFNSTYSSSIAGAVDTCLSNYTSLI